MATGTFSTAFNCMDGRTQEKAYAYAKSLFGTDYVDMVTEPGMDGLLAGEHSVLNGEALAKAQEWVRTKSGISAKGHGSTQAVIFGHCACAGNQVEKDVHIEHLKKAKEMVASWDYFEEIHLAVFNDDFELEVVE